MKTKPIKDTAVHEAGHFVFAMALGLGPVTKLTIKPDVENKRLGSCTRQPSSILEKVLRAEISGDHPEMIESYKKDADFWREYTICRRRIAYLLAIEALAGSAAEQILAGGDGKVNASDYHAAHRATAIVVSKHEIPKLLAKIMTEARGYCYGIWRAPILAVAERLMTKREFDAAACIDLWDEVRPVK